MTINTQELREMLGEYMRISSELAAENEGLRERLEINSEAPEWDGIACRDETIRNLEREIDALRAELQARQWQPIETAPKDGTRFLGSYLSNGMWFAEVVGGYPVSTSSRKVFPATYWHPLPLPPAPPQGDGA